MHYLKSQCQLIANYGSITQARVAKFIIIELTKILFSVAQTYHANVSNLGYGDYHSSRSGTTSLISKHHLHDHKLNSKQIPSFDKEKQTPTINEINDAAIQSEVDLLTRLQKLLNDQSTVYRELAITKKFIVQLEESVNHAAGIYHEALSTEIAYCKRLGDSTKTTDPKSPTGETTPSSHHLKQIELLRRLTSGAQVTYDKLAFKFQSWSQRRIKCKAEVGNTQAKIINLGQT